MLACPIPFPRALNLDDICAHVSQQLPGVRRGHKIPEFKDAHVPKCSSHVMPPVNPSDFPDLPRCVSAPLRHEAASFYAQHCDGTR